MDVSARAGTEQRFDAEASRPSGAASTLDTHPVLWTVAALCALSNRPAPAVPLPAGMQAAAAEELLPVLLRRAGFVSATCRVTRRSLADDRFPLIVLLAGESPDAEPVAALLLDRRGSGFTLAERDCPPAPVDEDVLAARLTGAGLRVAEAPPTLNDPDALAGARATRRFGFAWFLPALAEHKSVWAEVLLASLVLQLLALAFPLVTQAIIDKVIVHRTESTLIALAAALALFIVFSALLGWLRQYLLVHTGNRVDAALGAAVWAHLVRLPVAYFAHRPTGVVAARLHAVETVREFIASAAVTLLLDAPFLVIFIALMCWYSVTLTAVVLVAVALVAGLSLVVAPRFHRSLNEQFLQGARMQAYVTEYVAAIETVKCLQAEHQLDARYGGLLAATLQAGARTRHLANGYQTAAQALEQVMHLLVLTLGASIVMHADPARDGAFTLGMLVAFQMLAQRVSQPLLRFTALWQQLQQARLAVQRLGDVMDAPAEPYADSPRRSAEAGCARVEIEDITFRYAPELPPLYERLSLVLGPGSVTALMGPSGCGKSTLARLLLGFHAPSAGAVRIDGIDIRHLSANELRACFGVVPQETVLFSGTVRANLLLARPGATFEDVADACRQAQVHHDIERLPAGYDTELGERGTGLSGGQKQRIAIARALLRRPRLLIFDEATAHLDDATANAFARTVNALRGRATILFIAHALPGALQVDRVITLGAAPRSPSARQTDRAAVPVGRAVPHVAGAGVSQ